jgi:hypothetical protein
MLRRSAAAMGFLPAASEIISGIAGGDESRD